MKGSEEEGQFILHDAMTVYRDTEALRRVWLRFCGRVTCRGKEWITSAHSQTAESQNQNVYVPLILFFIIVSQPKAGYDTFYTNEQFFFDEKHV